MRSASTTPPSPSSRTPSDNGSPSSSLSELDLPSTSPSPRILLSSADVGIADSESFAAYLQSPGIQDQLRRNLLKETTISRFFNNLPEQYAGVSPLLNDIGDVITHSHLEDFIPIWEVAETMHSAIDSARAEAVLHCWLDFAFAMALTMFDSNGAPLPNIAAVLDQHNALTNCITSSSEVPGWDLGRDLLSGYVCEIISGHVPTWLNRIFTQEYPATYNGRNLTLRIQPTELGATIEEKNPDGVYVPLDIDASIRAMKAKITREGTNIDPNTIQVTTSDGIKNIADLLEGIWDKRTYFSSIFTQAAQKHVSPSNIHAVDRKFIADNYLKLIIARKGLEAETLSLSAHIEQFINHQNAKESSYRQAYGDLFAAFTACTNATSKEYCRLVLHNVHAKKANALSPAAVAQLTHQLRLATTFANDPDNELLYQVALNELNAVIATPTLDNSLRTQAQTVLDDVMRTRKRIPGTPLSELTLMLNLASAVATNPSHPGFKILYTRQAYNSAYRDLSAAITACNDIKLKEYCQFELANVRAGRANARTQDAIAQLTHQMRLTSQFAENPNDAACYEAALAELRAVIATSKLDPALSSQAQAVLNEVISIRRQNPQTPLSELTLSLNLASAVATNPDNVKLKTLCIRHADDLGQFSWGEKLKVALLTLLSAAALVIGALAIAAAVAVPTPASPFVGVGGGGIIVAGVHGLFKTYGLFQEKPLAESVRKLAQKQAQPLGAGPKASRA